MKTIVCLLLLQAFLCSDSALAKVLLQRSQASSLAPMASQSDRKMTIFVSSTDEDPSEELEKKPYPLKGLQVNLRLNYDTALEQGKDTWEVLKKISAEAQKYFLYTNGRPYLRLNIQKGESLTISSFGDLTSFAKRQKPDDIDADIYFGEKPILLNSNGYVNEKKVCRDKKNAVATVLREPTQKEADTGEVLAAIVAHLLGLKEVSANGMQSLFQRYEAGKLSCLKEECIDDASCTMESSCSDEVTALLCPKKCNKCIILYPPSGLQMRLRLNYNDDFETSWSSIGPLTAMHNILAHGETFFLDNDYKPYLHFEIVNGTKFTDPSTEGLKVSDLNALIGMVTDAETRDADIFFGTADGHVILGAQYGNAKVDKVCTNPQRSVGIVLQGHFSYEAGTADTLSKIVASLLGLRTNDKSSWTIKEFKDAYESGKYQCLKPYECHDQFPCQQLDASTCSKVTTKHLCPKLCGFCR